MHPSGRGWGLPVQCRELQAAIGRYAASPGRKEACTSRSPTVGAHPSDAVSCWLPSDAAWALPVKWFYAHPVHLLSGSPFRCCELQAPIDSCVGPPCQESNLLMPVQMATSSDAVSCRLLLDAVRALPDRQLESRSSYSPAGRAHPSDGVSCRLLSVAMWALSVRNQTCLYPFRWSVGLADLMP